MSLAIGLLTAHILIGSHAERLGVRHNDFCSSCFHEKERESIGNFICYCLALFRINTEISRYRIFWWSKRYCKVWYVAVAKVHRLHELGSQRATGHVKMLISGYSRRERYARLIIRYDDRRDRTRLFERPFDRNTKTIWNIYRNWDRLQLNIDP